MGLFTKIKRILTGTAHPQTKEEAKIVLSKREYYNWLHHKIEELDKGISERTKTGRNITALQQKKLEILAEIARIKNELYETPHQT